MKDAEGLTPLHMAAANGYKELVTLLIGQGSDINAADEVIEIHFKLFLYNW
jgi:ankyrin repeat protein